MPETPPRHPTTGFCATCGYPIEMTIISANNIRPEEDRAWLHTSRRNPETPPHSAMYIRGKSELGWSAIPGGMFKAHNPNNHSTCTVCGKPIVLAPISTGAQKKAWFHEVGIAQGHLAMAPEPTLGEALNDAADLPTSSDRDGIWFIDPEVRNRANELIKLAEEEVVLQKRIRELEMEQERVKRGMSKKPSPFRSHLTIGDYKAGREHPQAVITISAEDLVRKSFDQEAEGQIQSAQLSMLRAIYTQQAEMDVVYWARWDEDGEKTDAE